jgi:arabinogalactan endo-1,4-beta-galactosidase
VFKRDSQQSLSQSEGMNPTSSQKYPRHRNHAMVAGGLLLASVWMTCANQVTYQVNLSVQRALGNFDPAAGDTVLVSGTFSTTDWTTTSVLTPSAGDSNIYVGTFNNNVATGGTGQHKFIINPGGNSSAGQLIWESGANRTFQVTAANQTLPVVYFDNVTNAPVITNGVNPADFIVGVDMSHLAFFENRGIAYRVNGQTQDALAILKARGINCVRLRLFTSSAAQAQSNAYNYTNNLTYTLPLAVRVKNAGLKLLLDFHYSDTWADPGKQTKPAAWTNLTFAQLKTQIRDYSSNTIAALSAAGAMPDFVQPGNEITPGMLWDEGRVGGSFENTTQWSQLAQLLTNAIQGVKDAAGTNVPKFIIHLDRGGDWTTTQWYFDKLVAQQVAFDIIGQSYYPWWHGDWNALRTCLNNAAARYGKPVMVMETAFPRTNSTNIFGIPASTNGQVQFVIELAKIVKGVPGGRGAGIFWWGTEYQQLSGQGLAGFDQRSMFGSGGNVLPVAEVFGAMTAPVNLSPSVSNNLLILKWPLSGAGLALASATNLTSPVWTNTTNAIQDTNVVFSASVPLEGSTSRFFRLQSP